LITEQKIQVAERFISLKRNFTRRTILVYSDYRKTEKIKHFESDPIYPDFILWACPSSLVFSHESHSIPHSEFWDALW